MKAECAQFEQVVDRVLVELRVQDSGIGAVR